MTSADDGPHPYYTEELPDGLKERGVVATFFATGEHAALHPDVIKRIDFAVDHKDVEQLFLKEEKRLNQYLLAAVQG